MEEAIKEASEFSAFCQAFKTEVWQRGEAFEADHISAKDLDVLAMIAWGVYQIKKRKNDKSKKIFTI